MPDPALIAREILVFYREAGVTDVVGEEPADRLSGSAPAPAEGAPAPAERAPARPAPAEPVATDPPAPADPPTPARPTPTRAADRPSPAPTPRPAAPAPLSPDAAAMAAREAARGASTLAELRAILERFEGCGLRRTAKQLVFADGNPDARVMFVGEAPGREEDLEGLPFVGPSGQLLDRMMAAIGLDRTSAYVANIVPWRPPGNREPTPQESLICLPFIQRQIELSKAEILVCLGRPSTEALLGATDGIKRVRGRWFSYQAGARPLRATATFHPAYLLRSPIDKRLAWRDFLAIEKALAG